LSVDFYESQIRIADSLYKNYLPQSNFEEVKAAMEFFDSLRLSKTTDNGQQTTDFVQWWTTDNSQRTTDIFHWRSTDNSQQTFSTGGQQTTVNGQQTLCTVSEPVEGTILEYQNLKISEFL
jgi:hypothetical protein